MNPSSSLLLSLLLLLHIIIFFNGCCFSYPSDNNPVRRYQKNARKSRQQSRDRRGKNQFNSKDDDDNISNSMDSNGQYGQGGGDDDDDDFNIQPNMYAYTPPNHEPSYQENGHIYGDDEDEHESRSRQMDILDEYTSTTSSKLLVALSAAFFSTLLSTIISMMLTTKWSPVIVLPIGFLFFLSTFRKSSDLGQLARAFGVINILLMRRMNFGRSLTDLFLYLRAAFYLSPRHAYPPSENPWSHKFLPDDPNSIQFNM